MSSSEITDWAAVIVGGPAILVALVALVSNRFFQTREALARLLERFDSAAFSTLMWRMEQLTRPGPDEQLSLQPVYVDQLRKELVENDSPEKCELLAQAVGS